MCKVVKDYGTVAEHGSKTLKLQIIKVNNENKVSLVSYKDGMTMSTREFTKEDAKKMKALLEDYLGYKAQPVTKEKDLSSKNVHTLSNVPCNDVNYQTALRNASVAEIQEAIDVMKADVNGRHSTRIKACETALKKLEKTKKNDNKEDGKEEKKEKADIITFPTEDRKPKIIPLKTEGNRSYGECVVKAKKEMEMFHDADSTYVLEGILELCKVDDDFRNNFMREDKKYGDFMKYMFEAAKNGYCVKYGNVGWLDRDLALGLAIDWYNADCEKMKATKKEADKNESKRKGKKATA